MGKERSRELMRYVRISQPEIIDLGLRAKSLPRSGEAWAREYVSSKEVITSADQLGFDYFTHLSITTVPVEAMPSAADIENAAKFERVAATVRYDKQYQADVERCFASTYALRLLDDPRAVGSARILAFVEAFPDLARRPRPTPYPYPVLPAPVVAKKTEQKKPTEKETEPTPKAELGVLARDIQLLWKARNQLVAGKRAAVEAAQRALPEPVAPDQKATNGRRTSLLQLKQELDGEAASDELVTLLARDASELAKFAPGIDAPEIARAQRSVAALTKRHDLPLGTVSETYATTIASRDALGGPLDTLEDEMAQCFREHPVVTLENTVRLLGKADLVKVTETFLYYSEGEISYVESILAGEKRKRQVKNRKFFEEILERTSAEEKEQSSESAVTTKQDLSHQIESEISARMNSDVNASANGSGSGKLLGMVDVSGGANAAASMQLGVDTKFGSKSSSSFSQEVVAKAIERTKNITSERRVSRSTSLYMTIDKHEIENTSAEPRNGYYCFLDKHVCINEHVYGKRAFLLANVKLPGKNLLCERKAKLKLGMNELGDRPTFGISVDDITPATYKNLVAQYKATNVEPPPPVIQTVSKVYKTDSTSASNQAPAMKLTNVAEVLAPFFEEYKRYLITDNVKLPDGYEVAQVAIMVNHGANGISIPTHLPLKLAGATIGSGLTALTGLASGIFGPAIVVPFAAWQFLFSASPLLHYNTDSSNVLVCVGTETHDSPYFFFDPAYLVQEVFDLVGTLLDQNPNVVQLLKDKAAKLLTDIKLAAEKVPDDIKKITDKVVSSLVSNVESVINGITIGKIKDGLNLDIGIPGVDLSTLPSDFKAVFDPIKTFLDEIADMLGDGLRAALAAFTAYLSKLNQSSQRLDFFPRGMRGELPVSINTVAIKPGVTLNLVATLVRTEDSLDKWRLATFERLYQAYVQQVADYDARLLTTRERQGITKHPAILRNEELVALKELVLHTLNNRYDPNAGNEYSAEKMNAFENGIDWANASYRLFNYGPSYQDVANEKTGVFDGVDDRRVAFLKASWAQAMIPLNEHPALEAQMMQYMTDGSLDFESRVVGGLDAVTALYQSLVQERSLLAEKPDVRCLGEEVLPTEHIVVLANQPGNHDAVCEPTVIP